ncbi:MAG: FAD-binding oxidoreductase [Elusimicrobia bacterium]|nr:FAD-binding oxidoreductase [Elusimicrobiota bacterium]
MDTRPRVAVIGGGIFGACAALELEKSFSVTLLERNEDFLMAATYANHNRHHYGYHYPRSPETLLQCLEGRVEFERRYGECLDWDFDNYYCVAKSGSKTSARDYLAFCRRFSLEAEECDPDPALIDPSKIALCLKVREGVYDIGRLRALVKAEVQAAKAIDVRLNHEVVGASFGPSGAKVLQVAAGGKTSALEFELVVNATYAYTNRFCSWLGFAPRSCQFNLQEIDVVELPLARRIGVTVQDGNFPSIIPLAHTRRYLMAHVIESQLVRKVSVGDVPLLNRTPYIESNWAGVLEACVEYLPILRQVQYVKSIFVDRVVDSNRLQDDSRVSELTDHGRGCWSVFSAKVITCVTTAVKLHERMKEAIGVS